MWRLKALRYDLRQWILDYWRSTRWYQRRYKLALAEELFEHRHSYDGREIAKAYVQQEFFDPAPQSEFCPRCSAPLESFGGMVGETMIMCSRKKGCRYGWCNNAGAIARVI